MSSITVSKVKALPEDAQALLVGVFEGTKGTPKDLKAIDETLGGAVSRALSTEAFEAKPGQVECVQGFAGTLILIGLGDKKNYTVECFRKAVGTGAGVAASRKATKLSIHLDSLGGFKGSKPAAAGEALAEAFVLSRYSYREFKTNDKDFHTYNEAEVLVTGKTDTKQLKKGIDIGVHVAEAANFTRDLCNAPANKANPTYLAEQAKAMAKTYAKLSCTVWDFKKCEKEGMGSFCSVARGSDHANPAKFIILEWKGKASGKPVCLVGKGVTFDTGGISLKPGAGMWDMIYDMSGGGGVLGAMQAIARLNLPIRVFGIVPATHNMPDATATVPGDIVTASNGKTVEVLNTDAEGRLILADALVYACKQKPRAIIDMATLTGAVLVALGKSHAGIMSTDDDLVKKLSSAGERTAETLWRLPLGEDYSKAMKSEHADVRNIGMNRLAGTSCGGAFLQNFVEEGIPWAHLDIAGTANFNENEPYKCKGSKGFGVRLLTRYVRDLCGK